jgi:hypothetical protein
MMEVEQEGTLSVHTKAGSSMFLRNVGNNTLDQEVYCDMTPKRLNSGARQTAVAR